LKLLSLLVLVAIAAPNLKEREVVGVPSSRWLKLRSADRNFNVVFAAGETCVVKKHGLLTIDSIAGATALVVYSNEEPAGGTMCPDGARFAIALSVLQEMKEGYAALLLADKADKDVIAVVRAGKAKTETVGKLITGQTHTIPAWKWVNVGAPGKPEDWCGISDGAQVTILAFSEKQDRAYVKYATTGSTLGTRCPDDATFFLPVSELATFNDKYQALKEADTAERKLVITSQNTAKLGKVKAGDVRKVSKWTWVDVVNLEPVVQRYRNAKVELTFGETCGVEEGGTMTAVGFDEKQKRVLVRYKAPGEALGTPCPSGVLFFVPLEVF